MHTQEGGHGWWSYIVFEAVQELKRGARKIPPECFAPYQLGDVANCVYSKSYQSIRLEWGERLYLVCTGSAAVPFSNGPSFAMRSPA